MILLAISDANSEPISRQIFEERNELVAVRDDHLLDDVAIDGQKFCDDSKLFVDETVERECAVIDQEWVRMVTEDLKEQKVTLNWLLTKHLISE